MLRTSPCPEGWDGGGCQASPDSIHPSEAAREASASSGSWKSVFHSQPIPPFGKKTAKASAPAVILLQAKGRDEEAQTTGQKTPRECLDSE